MNNATVTGVEVPAACSVGAVKGSRLSTSSDGSTRRAVVTFRAPQIYIRLSGKMLPLLMF